MLFLLRICIGIILLFGINVSSFSGNVPSTYGLPFRGSYGIACYYILAFFTLSLMALPRLYPYLGKCRVSSISVTQAHAFDCGYGHSISLGNGLVLFVPLWLSRFLSNYLPLPLFSLFLLDFNQLLRVSSIYQWTGDRPSQATRILSHWLLGYDEEVLTYCQDYSQSKYHNSLFNLSSSTPRFTLWNWTEISQTYCVGLPFRLFHILSAIALNKLLWLFSDNADPSRHYHSTIAGSFLNNS